MQNFLVLLFFSMLLYCSPQNRNTARANNAGNKAGVANGIEKDTAAQHVVSMYQDIPQWYLKNRVQIHTLLTLRKDLNKPDFFDFPKTLAQYGVPVLTRQIKAADEEPWWQSSVGTLNPLTAKFNENGHNLAKDLIAQMHELNMKAIIYYRHIEDAEMLKLHPEWASRDINGSLVDNVRGDAMCFNSPYRNVVITRLKELSSYGADGFYFDANHIPPQACFCKYCQALYKKEYGSDLIGNYKAGDKLKFYAFRNNTLDRFFSDLRDSLHKAHYDPVLIVSGNTWPALTDLHMNSAIFHKFILKSELGLPARTINGGIFKMPAAIKKQLPGFYLNALVYSFERDNSFGPPHIWCPFIHSAEDANKISAGLISLGCIANLHIVPDSSDVNDFKEAISWDKKYGEHFKDIIPYSYTGILLSENQRNKMIATPAKAWESVLYPAYTVFEKLYDAGIPVQMVSDAGITKENINSLQQVYCNKVTTNTDTLGLEKKFADFTGLPSSSGKQLALSLNVPVFCLKENPFTHFNYFTGRQGYIYVIYAPDFTADITVRKENLKANAAYTNSSDFKKPHNYRLYIKKEHLDGNQIEDVVTGKIIKPAGEENSYFIFDIKENPNSALGIIRFKSNL